MSDNVDESLSVFALEENRGLFVGQVEEKTNRYKELMLWFKKICVNENASGKEQ